MRVVLLSCALILSSCDDGRPPPPPADAGPRRDAGPRPDAGPMRDSGVPSLDGALPDAGPIGPVCTAPDQIFKVGSDSRTVDRIVALAAGASGFAVAWNETRAGRPDLFGVRVASDGTLGAEQRITDNTSRENFPALLTVGNQWIVAFTDNTAATGFELYTRALGADVAPTASPSPITATAMLLDDNPSLFSASTGLLLAWVEDDAAMLTRIARARTLALDGTPSGAMQTASALGARPTAIALGELAAGPVALWAENGEVVLQPLTPGGAVSGTSTTLDMEGNADGSTDAWLTSSGGAVVFGALASGARSEVRFRALSSTGARLGDERILAEGTDASIAPFAGGFVVSYRAPEASAETTHAIRLLFVTSLGDTTNAFTIAPTLPAGGRTTVRVSGDGQIAVSWAELDAEVGINVALVRCQ